MRAICEQCSAAQPPSWAAGDLCTACGQSVRHEVRCFWCTTWTPAAAFCRTCGADVIDERLYGAARMLKDAGTDRFTVPEQLFSFAADRIENFTRIYQRHAVVAARHVDELHAVEAHLRDRRWSALLDDELAAQLPWSTDELARCSTPRPGDATDATDATDAASVVSAIRETTPFELTRHVAALALVQLGDWSALDEARAILHGTDRALRAEAALVLSSWRVRAAHDLREDLPALVAELEASPHRGAAGVRLAALRGDVDALPPDDVLAGDPESLFDAALQRGDADRLAVAVDGDDDLARIAAGRALVHAGVIAPLDRPMRGAPDLVRLEILDAMQRSKRPCDEVHDALVEVATTASDGRLRRAATRIACRSLDHDSAMRIARANVADTWDGSAIVQSLLQCDRIGADTVVAIADVLLDAGRFTMQQYGLATVADDGRLPDSFVPSRFAAADDATRVELLAVAERQLGQRADDGLHHFALRVLFGPHPSATRSAAMWVLRRWYRQQGDVRSEGPFVLHVPDVVRVFGDLDQFVTGLCAVLGDDATMREVGIYEYLAHLLGTADEEMIEALQRDRTGQRLVETLAVAGGRDYWPGTLESMWTLLSRLGTRDDWQGIALGALRTIDRGGNHHFDKAVERLATASDDQRRSITTLPTE